MLDAYLFILHIYYVTALDVYLMASALDQYKNILDSKTSPFVPYNRVALMLLNLSRLYSGQVFLLSALTDFGA